jgi:hypothetical protein
MYHQFRLLRILCSKHYSKFAFHKFDLYRYVPGGEKMQKMVMDALNGKGPAGGMLAPILAMIGMGPKPGAVAPAGGGEEAGLYRLNPVVTHSLKPPGSNP